MLYNDRSLFASFLLPVFLMTLLLTARFVYAATITVVNLDSPNEGFNDPTPVTPIGGNAGTTLGEQRLIAFQFAADMWSNLLDSPVEIKVDANFDPLPCNALSAVLGAAGPNSVFGDFSGAPVANTLYPQALANSLAGSDLDPNVSDIGAQFNSSFGTTCQFAGGWYFGLDGNPAADQVDFVAVILHEIGHGLGFLTLVNLATGEKFFGFDDAYMLHLEDHATGKLYPDMTNAERVAASTATGDLHWVGPAVLEAGVVLRDGVDSVSGHVEMYGPDPQEPGSSVSHFSDEQNPEELMEPFYTGPNDVGLALELLEDIGWITIPPRTWTGYGHRGYGWFVGDFNGDGKDDIFRQLNQYGGAEVLLSSGSRFSDAFRWNGYGHRGYGWYVGDFNRDGANDIFRQVNQYGGAEVFLSNGRNQFVCEGCGEDGYHWNGHGHRGYGWRVGDFNGDGKDDIFRQMNQYGGAEVFLSNGRNQFICTGCGEDGSRWSSAGHRGYGWYVGDFNGDGKDDIFRLKNQYGGAEVFLSNGVNQFVYAGEWNGHGFNGGPWYVGNFDGDVTGAKVNGEVIGKVDIFRPLNQHGGADVFLSQGNFFK